MRRRALLRSVPLGALGVAGCLTRDPGGTGTPRATSPGDGTPSATQDGPVPPEQVDTDWPMPGHDAGRSSFAAAPDGPTEQVAELWSTLADASLSAPALVDGVVYVGGDDGVVRAFDARTGEERWRRSVGAPAGTPRVFDDRCVVPTTAGLVALSPRDGTEAWRVETADRADVLVAPHGVYWLSRWTPTVVALARADGSERWRADLRDPWDPHLFACDGDVFVSSGTNGRTPWRLASETGDVRGDEPDPGHDFPAERFALDETVYAVDAFFGNVTASSVGERGQSWSQGVGVAGRYATSGGADHVYYVANGGEEPGLYALSRRDGAVEWHTDAVTAVVGRPVVTSECVLVRTGDALRCFDPSDGIERWSGPGDEIGERFLVADDLVYATRDGAVRAFRAP